MTKEQLFQMKGELTYNIEVLNARLIECNKQLNTLLAAEPKKEEPNEVS